MRPSLKLAAAGLCLVLSLARGVSGQPLANQTTTSSRPERLQRNVLFPAQPPTNYSTSFLLPIGAGGPGPVFPKTGVTGSGLPATSIVDNNAGRQLRADKLAFPFLSTLPAQGSSVFATVLKPCGSLSPHVYPRATAHYVVLQEENGGRQNIVFNATVGTIAVVPQGLLHYNYNGACTPNVFIQFFDSADPGPLSVRNALASLNSVDSQGIGASGFASLTSSSFGEFDLDQSCLQRCNLVNNPGTLKDLALDFHPILGLDPDADQENAPPPPPTSQPPPSPNSNLGAIVDFVKQLEELKQADKQFVG